MKRVTAQDIIREYYATPSRMRSHGEWHVRKSTFEQIDRDVYPVKISQQLMGLHVKIDHKMTEGKIKLVIPEGETQ